MNTRAHFVMGSGPMEDAFAKLRRVATLDTTVLIQGESGTGKELAARFLHENHPRRRHGKLICVHCGAIPETLLESELFGHVRGAFTGAERDRTGKFEMADGGTLFLDEVSTMTPEAQIRLLRVLQERRVTRVGAMDSRAIDVRVVAASNQNLKQLIDDGKFRLDLYYRLSTFPVALPALRERPGDIKPLVEHLSAKVGERLDLAAPKTFRPDALQAMAAHDWPGNVRELENVIEYASIQSLNRPDVGQEDLPVELSGIQLGLSGSTSGIVVTEDGLSFRTAVTNLERELILQSLRLAEGNKARAAELLDLKRTTFLEKLRRVEQDAEPALLV